MRKKTALLAILFIVIFNLAAVANAALYTSDYISRAQSDITTGSNGKLTINFTISSRYSMNQLGVKTIVLQERANANASWGEAKTYSCEDYPNMMTTNSGSLKSNVTYSNATAGYQYRAKVYFYAENGGYDSLECITGEVTAR